VEKWWRPRYPCSIDWIPQPCPLDSGGCHRSGAAALTRSFSLFLLVLSLALVGGAYASAFLPDGWPAWAPWALLVGTVTSLLAISLVGTTPPGGQAPRRLLVALGGVFLLLVGGVGAGLLLPAPGADSPLVGGLPPGAAFLVYGAGLLPLLVVPLTYAWVFPRVGFGEGEVEALTRRAREAAASRPGETGRGDGAGRRSGADR